VGLVVEDVWVARKPVIKEEGGVKEIVAFDYVHISEVLLTIVREYPEEMMAKLETEL